MFGVTLECTDPKVKHGGESLMIWSYMSTNNFSEIIDYTFIDSTMNACCCAKILPDKMTPSLKKLYSSMITIQKTPCQNNSRASKEIICNFLGFRK